MAITYVGGQVAGRVGTVGTTSVAFALTGGANTTPQPNDFVVITAVVGSQGRNPAQAISGYTALGQLNPTATTYDTSLNVSYKVMGNTPDASFTLPSTGDAADAQRYTVQVFRGVDVAGLASASATGTGTSRPDPASITPTVAGSWVLICGGGASATGSNYTGPANFTTNFLTGFTADTNDATVGSGYWDAWSSGAVNPAAYTGGSTNAADSWAAYTIVLPPAADVARSPLTFVDESHDADNTFSSSTDTATPPTVSVGDLEILWAAAGALAPAAAPTIATPSGWEYAGNGGSVPAVGGVVNTRVHLFYRISPDTGSNATLSTGVNCAFVWGRLSYSDPDPTHPLRQVVFGADAGGDTNIVLSSLNALVDSVLSGFITLGAAQNITPPGSMTERFDNATFGSSAADEVAASTGATGTRTFTLGSNADAAWGFAEFLGAPSGGGGVTGTLSVTEGGSDAFEASDGKLHFIGTSTGGPVALLTSLDIPPPPGMKAGHRDLLLVGLGAVEPSAAPAIGTSLGTGWEYLGQSGEINIGSGVFALRLAAFARVADGPGSDVTVTSDIAGYWGWHRSAWLNPNASSFIGQTAIFGGVTSTTTPVIPGLTTTKSNSYLLQWQVLGESAVITPPSGTTELDENVPNALGLYGERIPSIAATGSRTYGYSPTSDAGYVVLELHGLMSQAATAQGTLSATEQGGDTAALTGVVVVAGSLAAGESGGDIAALAGAVLVSGALSVSEVGSDSAAITGSQVATGTLSATESGSDAAALAGAVPVQGALAASESGSDTSATTGKALVQGALSVTETGADTGALSGAVLVQGSAAVTESGQDSFAGTGSLTGGITGSLNATESGSDALVSTGAIVVTGVFAVTETGSDIAAMSGAVRVQGSVAASEFGPDTFSATGSAPPEVTGILVATEQGADGAALSGSILVSGLISASEEGSDTALFLGSGVPASYSRAPSGYGYQRTTQINTYRPSTGTQTARPHR